VELYGTIDQIAQQHRGEGFLHEEKNPTVYSRDPSLRELKSLIVTRLLLYQDGDFGTISNDQCER
jgi:hypothetical protein